MRSFELLLSPRKVVTWDGADGEDAARAYVASHPEATVVAWRAYPQHGLFIGPREIVEPGHWRYGR